MLVGGHQKLLCGAANSLAGGPAVERLGGAFPVDDPPPQIDGDDRLPNRFEQTRLEANLLFRALALRDAVQHDDMLHAASWERFDGHLHIHSSPPLMGYSGFVVIYCPLAVHELAQALEEQTSLLGDDQLMQGRQGQQLRYTVATNLGASPVGVEDALALGDAETLACLAKSLYQRPMQATCCFCAFNTHDFCSAPLPTHCLSVPY